LEKYRYNLSTYNRITGAAISVSPHQSPALWFLGRTTANAVFVLSENWPDAEVQLAQLIAT
jgi:hypothetical protein